MADIKQIIVKGLIGQVDDIAWNGYYPNEIPEQASERIAQAVIDALQEAGMVIIENNKIKSLENEIEELCQRGDE